MIKILQRKYDFLVPTNVLEKCYTFFFLHCRCTYNNNLIIIRLIIVFLKLKFQILFILNQIFYQL